jgi:hypothetical protein
LIISSAIFVVFLVLTYVAWRRYLWASESVPGLCGQLCLLDPGKVWGIPGVETPITPDGPDVFDGDVWLGDGLSSVSGGVSTSLVMAYLMDCLQKIRIRHPQDGAEHHSLELRR